MRRLTLGYLTLFGSSQVEVIDAAAATGFRSVGLRVHERHAGDGFPFPVPGNRQRLNDIKSRLAASDVFPSSITGRFLVPGTTSDELAALVEVGAELNSPQILVNSDDPDEQRTIDNIARLAAYAATAGIKVGIEFVPFHSIRSLPAALRIAAATGAHNVGLILDVLHLSRSGGHPADIASIPLGLIHYAQICDARAEMPSSPEACKAESRTGRLYPGEGALPLDDFLRSLPPDCEVEVEVPNAGDAPLPPLVHAARTRAAFDRVMQGH